MAFFDKLKKQATSAIEKALDPRHKTQKITFADLPETLEAFKALPEAQLASPFETAALTVVAFCLYPVNKELCHQMLNYLRGPRPMSEMDKQFIRDRFLDKDYVPRSYFDGATPAKDYMPSKPYTITVTSNPRSLDDPDTVRLYINSGGADSPRLVSLRKAKDGKWYLWEQYLLADIRKPESENPWA